VNSIELYFEVHGSGKPTILLHTGLSAVEMFGANLPALAAGRQVIAVDLQGHRRTTGIVRPRSIARIADDVAALIRHLNLDRPDLVGYSMGGSVALQIAARHPTKVGKLVVIGLASLPELTYDTTFSDPALADSIIPFLDEPAPAPFARRAR
jgi:pimeloyl-ACP methyl ester carboxylesterase